MRPRILIVDDEPLVARAVARTLSDDFDADAVCSGIEALDAMSSRGPYAVILADLHMPHMDGAAFLIRAYSIAPGTQRILLTGYHDADLATHAIKAGHVCCFLAKPCSPATVRSAVDEAVQEYQIRLSETAILMQIGQVGSANCR